MTRQTTDLLASMRSRLGISEADASEVDANLAKAKAAFLKATGLPKDVVEVGDHAQPVPKQFKTLWKELRITTRLSALSDGGKVLFLQWQYTHPAGNANSYRIGEIAADGAEGAYRLHDESGDRWVKVAQ